MTDQGAIDLAQSISILVVAICGFIKEICRK